MGYLAYLIAGGAVMGEGGPLIMLGLLYRWQIPSLMRLWTILTYIGIASLIAGAILLIIGLVKRSQRYDQFK
ncbi:MAG: hypothetical protein HWN66_05610 [Candidatus Helarchaeota archaeon]|nr:hypothetical protein [Candidatus Helarchaeota archaeon]